MAKKPIEYAIPAGYGHSSPMDFRRLFSDLISKAIYKRFDENGPIFEKVYQNAANLTSGHCFYCNMKLSERDNSLPRLIQGTYAWDHFVPASQYGLFIIGNVVLACETCNLEKSNWPADEYWEQRYNQKQPLRYKTRDEFKKVADHLTALERDHNTANFYPVKDLENDPTDILEACRIVGASSIAQEYLEAYTPASLARWLNASRADADILAQLADVDDEAGLYELYETRNRRRCQGTSRNDVRGRVSRFTEMMEEVTGRNDVRELTPREYRALIKFTMEKFHDKVGERDKYRRLFRILAEHPELQHLRPVAWDQQVMA